jgi:hypothetical protein
MSGYRAPFITETNEPRFTDCQFCSGLMLVADWTDGEAIHDGQGNTRDAAGLRALRERIRVLSGDLEGDASIESLALGIAKRYPDLPSLPRTTAPNDPLRLSFDDLWPKLQDGFCAVLDGNPIKVKDPASPPRSMQANDDYDHAIFLHGAGPKSALVLDPLGRRAHDGRWVAEEDLRQFASRFVTADGSPAVAMVRRGHESSIARLRRTLTAQPQATQTELDTAKAAIGTARSKALDDAVKAIAALSR